MAQGPYRTPLLPPPAPASTHAADDSALPIVALVIVLVALAPPLSFGVLHAWLGSHGPDRVESSLDQAPARR